MGVLWDQKTYLKIAAMIFIEETEMGPWSRLLNEILSILAAQGDAIRREFKVGDQKKIACQVPLHQILQLK